MPFPGSAQGLVPWMNGRVDAGPFNALPFDTTVSFQPNGNITFQWIEDGAWTQSKIDIYAHGQWGPTSIGHTVIVRAIPSTPGSTTHTVANRTALFAILPVNGETALVSSDSSYWIVVGGRWIRSVVEVNAGTVSAYGITATVYTITIPQSDVPQLNNVPLQAGTYYELCWEENGLHAPQYDAIFNIAPLTVRQGIPQINCPLCGIRLKKPRPIFYWPNGKPKCAMQ